MQCIYDEMGRILCTGSEWAVAVAQAALGCDRADIAHANDEHFTVLFIFNLYIRDQGRDGANEVLVHGVFVGKELVRVRIEGVEIRPSLANSERFRVPHRGGAFKRVGIEWATHFVC